MGGLFSSPKSVDPPPPPAPPPEPPAASEEAGAQAARRVTKTSRRQTFLTGELTPETGRKTTLG